MADEPDMNEGLEQPEPPKSKTIKIGDQDYEVPEHVATAVESERAQYQSTIEQQTSKIDSLQKTEPPKPPNQPEETDYADLLFSDPAKFVNTVIGMAKAGAEEVTQGLTEVQQQEKVWNEFWKGFYKGNKDFDKKQDDVLVRAVLSENWMAWKDKQIPEVHKLLAEKTRGIIKGYMKKPDTSVDDIEGAGGGTLPKVPPDEDNKVVTMADGLRERRRRLFG